MANRSNQNNNQSGQTGKVAGIAAGIAAASGASGFGAGYGGAAVYDNLSEPVAVTEDMVIEEDVEVVYDEEPQEQTLYIEPEPESALPEVPVIDVPVIVTDNNLEDVDPDAVTDAILAEEMVDPADIDDVTVVEFTELNKRYDADGNEMTVAYFHNNHTDSDMMLVDVNGDGTFDYVADADGNYYADTVMGTVFTVDDVEAQLSDGTYLAANGTPDAVLDNGESYLNDIVTV